MHFGRRLVTLFANLALLQLVLLGSGAPCDQPMPDTGPHAAHAEAGHDAAHAAALHGAHESAPSDDAPGTDCTLRACAISPISLVSEVLLVAAEPLPTDAFPAVDAAARSALHTLDPPPPRA